ncbi:MAG: HIT domain-containing protein, partial [Nitrosopumilus sp.]
MEDCIFCKIIAGKIPSAKVYEDKNVISFLDIMPANKGHCLVVPKKHYETLLDIPDEDLTSLIKATKKITKALSL